ncbi:Uncharacterised protein (plasmid) [Tsukamurella tyrosinosolvens]|uniref:Uncharacterized protein n=1 Tax=Tsukamurella tyrosinosolvens TaxID=57704 RepID=A0A1H4V4V0_TSUTY|nr:hypothetical protein [Tsukamurella tyrosinosolvens]KXO91050.1 hypothetical protein AXK58_21710 [Tsukamurella tyrosinosolvens]SEC75943.1 hypothetical protein SAMN04489793_3140 [Tsukamurella tyrosinosolvens]VEH90685.1 Uncharacterised protein [Tsukamurella tyrosinosolvens]
MADTQTDIRSALELVGVEVPADVTVILDDAGNGRTGSFHRISLGQLEAALNEHRSVTGEELGDIDDFERELGWY